MGPQGDVSLNVQGVVRREMGGYGESSRNAFFLDELGHDINLLSRRLADVL